MPVLTDEDVGISAPKVFSDADVGLVLTDADVGLTLPKPKSEKYLAMQAEQAALREKDEGGTRVKVLGALEEHVFEPLSNPAKTILKGLEAIPRTLLNVDPHTPYAMDQPMAPKETFQKAVEFVTPGSQSEGSVGQAVQEFVSEMGSEMSKPDMLAYLLLGKKFPEPVARLFQGQMAGHLPESIKAVEEAETGKEKTKAALGLAANVAFPIMIEGGMRKHLADTAPIKETAAKVGPATAAVVSGEPVLKTPETAFESMFANFMAERGIDPGVARVDFIQQLRNAAKVEAPVETTKGQAALDKLVAEVKAEQAKVEPPVEGSADTAPIGPESPPKEATSPPTAPESPIKEPESPIKTPEPPSSPPSAAQPARAGVEERAPDLIDTFEAQAGGKLSLSKAKALIEDFKPTGALRKLFAKDGMAPDVAAQATGFKGSDVEFLEALQQAASGRKAMRERKSADKAKLQEEEKAVETFQEEVPFQARKVAVEYDVNRRIIESGKLPSGKKATPAEIEKLQQRQAELEPEYQRLSGQSGAPPRLRPGEKQGDLLSTQEEAFALAGEKGVDAERVAAEKAVEEAKAEAAAMGTPEFVGMGGATPGEFDLSAKTATSIKNATVDQERASRGLPPAMQPAKRTFGDVWDQAMARIDQDPGATDALLRQLRDEPRALTDLEDALLLHRQIELQNQYGKLTRELAQAFDDGRVEDVADLKVRVAEQSNQLLDLYDINKAVGTETGRGLAARKMLAYEDFSLAKMELEKRAAKGGEQLTDAERAEVVRLQEKIEQTQKAYDEYVAKTEEKLRQAEIDRAWKEVAGGPPEIEPAVLSLAERIVRRLEKQADASREYLRGKLFTISPDVLFHLSRIGAAQIARTGLDFTRWSTAMIGEFGEKLKPYVEEVFEASKKFLESDAERAAGNKKAARAKRAKRVITGEERAERQAAITESIKERVEAKETDGITPLVQRLARVLVESGIKEREPLIDAVWDVLKKVDPEMTRREAMDAISGYGRFKQLTKDEISTQLRDLKGQMQQVAKLEDIESRKPPQKTGVERRSPSDEERRLIKLVNEAKRRFGVVVTDPSTQLKSALDARKTYYRNQITDLEAQIASKEKFVKDRTESPTDAELDALKARRDELKKEFDDVFGKPELTDAQRVARAEKAAERSIEELSRRINEGDIGPKAKKEGPTSPQLEALKAEREQLKEMLGEMKDAANPKKTPEEIALKTLKSRLQRQITTLNEKLAKGDFSKKEPRKIQLDEEALKLHYEAAKAKIKWQEGLIKDRLARRSVPEKILGTVGEVLNTSRAVLTAFDLSAVLRQGGFISLAHPIRAAKSFPAMIRALRSEAGQHAVTQEILSRKNYPLYQQSKLYLAEQGHRLSQMEEAYMSRWADKIPGVGASQRAYTTFLNKLRADSFDAMVNTLSRDGTVTPHEMKAIANFINVATGRGSFDSVLKRSGRLEAGATFLSTVFFAPRYVASRFQLIAGQPFYRGTRRTRKAMAKEYARYLIGVGVVYGLGHLAGAEIETDSKSSDFGKLRFDNTRIDPMSGLQQAHVLIWREITGEKTKLSGETVSIRGEDVPYGEDDAWDVLTNFGRTKASPLAGGTVDVLTRKDVTGKPVTLASATRNLIEPLAWEDVVKAMQEQGVPRGTAMAILSIFGMGLQTYEDR